MKFQMIRRLGKVVEMELTDHGMQVPAGSGTTKPLRVLNPRYGVHYHKNTRSIDERWYVMLNCGWVEATRLPDRDETPIPMEKVVINFKFPHVETMPVLVTASNGARQWIKQMLQNRNAQHESQYQAIGQLVVGSCKDAKWVEPLDVSLTGVHIVVTTQGEYVSDPPCWMGDVAIVLRLLATKGRASLVQWRGLSPARTIAEITHAP